MVESVKDFYSKNAENQAKQYKNQHLAEKFLAIREKFAEKVGEGRVLDAGCGTGRDSEYFEREGLESYGVDIAEGMIELANHGLGNFKVSDFRELSFEDNYFDGIWCSASIFFVPPEEMENALKEFRRVIKKEGVLFVDFKKGEGKTIKEKWGSKVEEWHVDYERARKLIKESDFTIAREIENTSNTGNKFLDFFCKPKTTEQGRRTTAR